MARRIVLACSATLVAGVLLFPAVPVEARPPLLELASVSVDGTEGNGSSFGSSISADGRYVAFESDADNLVPGDANHTEDVFVRDIPSGKTSRVSLGWHDGEGQRPSFGPAISADGRVVAFESFAPLVPDDTNRMLDVYVRDLATGTTTRSSVGSGGEEGNAGSFSPALSADGRYVAFTSAATNLVPSDRNGLLDVFLHDRETGKTELVSVGYDGREANGFSFTPAISADGHFVAFPSEATNLVPGDTNGVRDIFLRDVVAGRTTQLSTPPGGGEPNGPSLAPAISASGGVVAFGSFASNLVAKDWNALQDVFVAAPGEAK